MLLLVMLPNCGVLIQLLLPSVHVSKGCHIVLGTHWSHILIMWGRRGGYGWLGLDTFWYLLCVAKNSVVATLVHCFIFVSVGCVLLVVVVWDWEGFWVFCVGIMLDGALLQSKIYVCKLMLIILF